ncbi:MAG: hypothetical protein V2J89_01955 [Halieaceae bacterium]|nr:hypothetical protein [Halieaceae bacterium]
MGICLGSEARLITVTTGQRQQQLQSLENRGMEVINTPLLSDQQPLCIVVLGAARGGTSAVAGVLSALGVNMGYGALPPVYEDLELALAIEADDLAAAQTLIDKRKANGLWGFKRPGFSRFVARYHPLLGNVRYIAVFRDPLATALRAQLSSEADLMTAMRSTLEEQSRINALLQSMQAPALMLSYEKMLQHPEYSVQALASFCGCEGADTAAAIARLQASPADYLDHTRNNKSRGRLDIVEARRIRGWAQYMTHRRTADVAIEINGREVVRVTADRYRRDLADMGISADGRCAFDVALSEPLKPGDVVRALVTGDPFDLMNSPFTYQPAPGTLQRVWRRLRSTLQARG